MKHFLELFAGTRSLGKIAEKNGYFVNSVELDPEFGCNITMDILEFDCKEYYKKNGVPDVIWASPPCTGFSVAAIGKNWVKGEVFTPKTESAKMGIKLLQKTIEIIKYFQEINSELIYFIENPRGKMRKAPFMSEFNRNTVTYCQYGDNRMKPTDIWTNSKTWKPKKICKNGDTCHVSAPRGSSTGTQGIKGAKDRSIIPERLCEEIILSTLL